jgi:hypothetical protein
VKAFVSFFVFLFSFLIQINGGKRDRKMIGGLDNPFSHLSIGKEIRAEDLIFIYMVHHLSISLPNRPNELTRFFFFFFLSFLFLCFQFPKSS